LSILPAELSRLMPLAPKVKPLPPELIDEYTDAMVSIHNFDYLPAWIQKYLTEVHPYAFIATYSDDVEKHLAGQHDQSTHGRGKGGVHNTTARRELWATDKAAHELKTEVSAAVAKRMIELGVTQEQFEQYIRDTKLNLVTPAWEGERDSKGIIVASVGKDYGGNPVVTMENFNNVVGYYTGKVAFKDKVTLEEVEKALAEASALSSTQFSLTPSLPNASEIVASDLIGQWAQTSNNESVTSLSLQELAKQKFKLEGTANWDTEGSEESIAFLLKQHGPLMESFLQAQYDNTQAMFKSKGITEISVYRGMQKNAFDLGVDFEGKDILQGFALQSRPLSSWSTSLDTADSFATNFSTGTGTIFRQVIPVSRVIGTPFSGVGCLKEEELVILGGIDKTDVTDSSSWGGRVENNPMYYDYENSGGE